MALGIPGGVVENPENHFSKLFSLYENAATEVTYEGERYFVTFSNPGVFGEDGDRTILVSFARVNEEIPRLSGPTFAITYSEKNADFTPSANSDLWGAFGVEREFVEKFIAGLE